MSAANGLILTYTAKTGVDGNTLLGLVVKPVAAESRQAEGATVKTAKTVNDWPLGIVAHADDAYVGVQRGGLCEAYFGAAYDPAADGKLLTFDGNSKLIAASVGDMVVAEHYDGEAIGAIEAADGAYRRVRVLDQPFILT